METAIDRAKYPQLDQLLWDTSARYLTPKDALNFYERRWGFVDKGAIQVHEQALINRLAQEAGGFLPTMP